MHKSELIQTLSGRGFIYQATDLEGLDTKATSQTIVGYVGFDPTASSLHVGNLVQIMRMRWLQQLGHKPIILVGGATAKIGDPSGKDTQRQMLDQATIDANIANLKKVFSHYVRFGDGPTDAVLVNNDDWWRDLGYIDVLRTIGSHFSVNRMLTFDTIRNRLDREQPLSFLEFNYMILQAYDFVHLGRTHHCDLQFGGSEQWGNIVSGVELARRLDKRHVFGLTSSLITTSSGEKMGKTANGAVWLDADRLSSYDYWQFWRNTSDSDVGRFFKLFTDLPLHEIARLEALQGAELNAAKKILADATTTMLHGADAATTAHQTAASVFSHSAADLSALPVITLQSADLDQGVFLIDVLVQACFAASKGEARRLIRGNSIKWRDNLINDEAYQLTTANSADIDGSILSSGKKKFIQLKVGN